MSVVHACRGQGGPKGSHDGKGVEANLGVYVYICIYSYTYIYMYIYIMSVLYLCLHLNLHLYTYVSISISALQLQLDNSTRMKLKILCVSKGFSQGGWCRNKVVKRLPETKASCALLKSPKLTTVDMATCHTARPGDLQAFSRLAFMGLDDGNAPQASLRGFAVSLHAAPMQQAEWAPTPDQMPWQQQPVMLAPQSPRVLYELPPLTWGRVVRMAQASSVWTRRRGLRRAEWQHGHMRPAWPS